MTQKFQHSSSEPMIISQLWAFPDFEERRAIKKTEPKKAS
jgi:hypothetical protein